MNELDYNIIMLVVNNHWRVEKRISKLRSLGYAVSSEWVKSGGIGTVRTIRGSKGVQVSSAIGGNNYVGKAYVAFCEQ